MDQQQLFRLMHQKADDVRAPEAENPAEHEETLQQNGLVKKACPEENRIVVKAEEDVQFECWISKLEVKHRCSSKCADSLEIINLEQVAGHDTADDCWIVIYDYVYDCTELLEKHPGGQDILVEYAGRDATLAFVGTGHSASARLLLRRYLIGELPFHERIFRKPGGIRIV